MAMTINLTQIKLRDLFDGYVNSDEDGVVGYHGRLDIRPKYQREFIYGEKEQIAVIETIKQGFPLNTMYWAIARDENGNKILDADGNDTYELMDGQQRTISACEFLANHIVVNFQKFFNIQRSTPDIAEQILDYELQVYICDGTVSDKLAWFETINIAGETLTNQELLNATYAGTWLADAKNYFSKRNCVAGQMADGFIKGNPIRQDYLEKALSWIADRDGLPSGGKYMAIHQHDADANDLWLYFQEVISWAKRMFPDMQKKLTECQEWGLLYNKYRNNQYNTNEIRTLINKLLQDEDVTKQAGIIPYVLSDRTKHDEKLLSIRVFSEQMKRRVYTKQTEDANANHTSNCPVCARNGITTIYEFEDMQGDHIIPWSQGGRTVEDNCQMLCQRCNNDKSAQ